MVTPSKDWVELCVDPDLVMASGDFHPGEVGIVVENGGHSRWKEVRLVRVLSQSGVTGWIAEEHVRVVL